MGDLVQSNEPEMTNQAAPNDTLTDEDANVNDGGMHCGHGDLLGPLGLFVQVLLAFIAFTVLIGKSLINSNPIVLCVLLQCWVQLSSHRGYLELGPVRFIKS